MGSATIWRAFLKVELCLYVIKLNNILIIFLDYIVLQIIIKLSCLFLRKTQQKDRRKSNDATYSCTAT